MKSFKIFALTGILSLGGVSLAFAGGGYIIDENGSPSLWDNSAAISYHPESGICGSFTNAEMRDKLETELARWDGLSDVDLDLSQVAGAIATDVTSADYTTYYVGFDDDGEQYTTGLEDGLNPIIFDDDGEIIAEVAGNSNKFNVLGFANPSGFTSDFTEIVDGQAVINCRCLAGNANGECCSGGLTDCANPVVFSEDETDFTIVHEFGHFLNLDHTQVNAEVIDDGDDDNDDDLATMYPISVNAAEQISPTRDDIVALASLYPSSSFNSSTCTVTGSLLDSSGNELRCADVQAVTTDLADTVAFVSGALAPAVDNNGDGDTADDGECTSDCGDFILHLLPGKTYTIKVMPIDTSFIGGSGISPCANGQLTGIVEQELEVISGTTCTAGGTFAFPSALTTTSTGGTTASGADTTSSSSLGCTLNAQAQPVSLLAMAWLLLPIGLLVLRKKLLIANISKF